MGLATKQAIYILVGLITLNLLIVPLLLMVVWRDVPLPASVRQPLAQQATATPPFQLPPTWTPEPTPYVFPSPVGTPVFRGTLPPELYQKRLQDPAYQLTWPRLRLGYQPNQAQEVLDLARILQGESAGDVEAAYRVGWVAKNRLLHPSYGRTYFEVSHGFFGYRADRIPNDTFMELARRVIRAQRDPTDGCLYALSRTDITNLGVPASRADVTYGEWFFFRVWPL